MISEISGGVAAGHPLAGYDPAEDPYFAKLPDMHQSWVLQVGDPPSLVSSSESVSS